MWLVVVFFILAMFWAYFAEIEEVTRGEGKVIPSGQVQIVQNLEGGIILDILVDVGDVVEKGQLLLRIDETRFSASYQENRLSYLALLAKSARLQAEAGDTEFVVPRKVTEEKLQIGQWEQELFDSRKKQHATKLEMYQEQVTQREQELKEFKVKLVELRRTSKLLQKEISLNRPLVAQGAVSEVELLHLERQGSQMNGEIEGTKLAIPRIHSKLTEALAAVEQEKLDFYNKAKIELNEVLAKLEGLSASSVALEDRLKRTAVRSPVKGTINQILVNTVGGVISPGMDLIEIVPMEDTLLVEARIKPADIAFLHPDQQAMVKFSAYDFTVYGGLDANLQHISADSITDEQGNTFYLVRLRTKINYIGEASNTLPIIPGMVATIDILTGKKTILAYLLKPILRAKYMALRER